MDEKGERLRGLAAPQGDSGAATKPHICSVVSPGDLSDLSDLSDRTWASHEPLLSRAQPGGRPRVMNLRRVRNDIISLLLTGCAWRYLPCNPLYLPALADGLLPFAALPPPGYLDPPAQGVARRRSRARRPGPLDSGARARGDRGGSQCRRAARAYRRLRGGGGGRDISPPEVGGERTPGRPSGAARKGFGA